MARQAHTDERGSVHGVNPGTELGRYTVDTRIETIPGGERWTARDATLEREVALLVMPADEPSTAAALDAARRAAGVEAAQLVRILDVGTEDGWSFIAEDLVSGAQTLTEAIGEDGLPAEEVRRITGEVATGLEAARTRGLHHLVLTPDCVLLTQDGRIKVRGLATSAALAGIETEGEDADRDDATAVVALAYAGLTATWPMGDSASGPTSMPAAPDDGDGPPSPSRVAVGVPGDLGTICRETLAEGTGPDSPGDYAAQIAPWSRIPLAGSVRTTPESQQAATALADQGRAPEDEDSTSVIASAGSLGAGAWSAAATDPEDESATREIPLHRSGSPTDALPTTSVGGDTETGERDAHSGTGVEDERRDEDDRTGPGGRTAAAAAAATAAAGAVGTGGKVIGERLGKAAKSARDRSQDAIHDARARREAIRNDQATRTSLGAAPVSDDLEAPAPLLPAEAGAAPSRQQTNLVLVIMAAFVAVACLVGAVGTSRIGDGSDLGKILGGDETTAVATSESSTGSGSDGRSGGGGDEPLAILNAAGFDPPPGDGVEHNAEVQRVYDGDPSTTWTTEGYNDETFGGVKEGVGITVDLGQPQDINSVTLVLPTTAQATVFAGDQATNSGTEIGKTEGKDGEVELEASSPVKAQYVTVWFTSLAQSGDDGRYRAAVGEITVR